MIMFDDDYDYDDDDMLMMKGRKTQEGGVELC